MSKQGQVKLEIGGQTVELKRGVFIESPEAKGWIKSVEADPSGGPNYQITLVGIMQLNAISAVIFKDETGKLRLAKKPSIVTSE